jgi:DNA-binding NarL/FixJ family response regulator
VFSEMPYRRRLGACDLNVPLSLLLADDDPNIRRCLKHAVEFDDRLIVQWEADNGLQAVALAQQFHPAVILIDCQMERMNGIEATRCIRSRDKDVKIVVMSVYYADREPALAAGADAFIVKDSGCEVIRHTIYKLLPAITEAEQTE